MGIIKNTKMIITGEHIEGLIYYSRPFKLYAEYYLRICRIEHSIAGTEVEMGDPISVYEMGQILGGN